MPSPTCGCKPVLSWKIWNVILKAHFSNRSKSSSPLLKLTRTHRKIINDRETVLDYLENNIVYEDGEILAVNKPTELGLSYHPPNSYKGAKIPLHEQPINLEALLPELRRRLGYPGLEISVPLQRLYSGVLVFGKDVERAKEFKRKAESFRRHKVGYQQMNLICVGEPKFPENTKDLFLNYEKINGVPQSQILFRENVSKKMRDRKVGDLISVHGKVVSSKKLGKGDDAIVSHVKLQVTSSALDVCQSYLAVMLAPVLGDRIYHNRVSYLMGKAIKVDPRVNNEKFDLCREIKDRLQISGKEDIDFLPLMVHKSEICVPSHVEQIIRAPPPEYFQLALKSLSLKYEEEEEEETSDLLSFIKERKSVGYM